MAKAVFMRGGATWMARDLMPERLGREEVIHIREATPLTSTEERPCQYNTINFLQIVFIYC